MCVQSNDEDSVHTHTIHTLYTHTHYMYMPIDSVCVHTAVRAHSCVCACMYNV